MHTKGERVRESEREREREREREKCLKSKIMKLRNIINK
jgi:hypothetical protein